MKEHKIDKHPFVVLKEGRLVVEAEGKLVVGVGEDTLVVAEVGQGKPVEVEESSRVVVEALVGNPMVEVGIRVVGNLLVVEDNHRKMVAVEDRHHIDPEEEEEELDIRDYVDEGLPKW